MSNNENTLFRYMSQIISTLRDAGREGTALNYHHTLNSFKHFRDNHDIMLKEITPALMDDYQAWLLKRGISTNSISFYHRILRAVYNRAVRLDIITDRHPFRGVYTGIDKTIKRALPVADIRRIRSLDLADTPALDFARDMFIMSFLLRGMSFVDMAYLRKTDLRNGHVIYRRRKTNQLLTVAWAHQMQDIVNKYPANKSEYLLPIIRNKGLNERCAYRNAEYAVNSSLKQIERMLDIGIPLTMYVARHSWASAAHDAGIPLRIISEALGHESESTTRIYLATLDTTRIDAAAACLIDAICS